VRRAKDEKCIGVSLNFDVYDEPDKVNASQGIAYALDMLGILEHHIHVNILDASCNPFTANPILFCIEFIESRQRQKLPKGRGKLLHSFMMGTPDDTDEGESVATIEAMEDYIIRMAHENRFMGVLTTNTNALTRVTAIYL